jgi:hypothetical protein
MPSFADLWKEEAADRARRWKQLQKTTFLCANEAELMQARAREARKLDLCGPCAAHGECRDTVHVGKCAWCATDADGSPYIADPTHRYRLRPKWAQKGLQ